MVSTEMLSRAYKALKPIEVYLATVHSGCFTHFNVEVEENVIKLSSKALWGDRIFSIAYSQSGNSLEGAIQMWFFDLLKEHPVSKENDVDTMTDDVMEKLHTAQELVNQGKFICFSDSGVSTLYRRYFQIFKLYGEYVPGTNQIEIYDDKHNPLFTIDSKLRSSVFDGTFRNHLERYIQEYLVKRCDMAFGVSMNLHLDQMLLKVDIPVDHPIRKGWIYHQIKYSQNVGLAEWLNSAINEN